MMQGLASYRPMLDLQFSYVKSRKYYSFQAGFVFVRLMIALFFDLDLPWNSVFSLIPFL